MRNRVAVWIVVALVSACASLPLKQKAVLSLQASETALEAAHDAERRMCNPNANKAAPITHCEGQQAAAIGLTDAQHQQIARAFVKAFDMQIKAATALNAWRAGDPPPSNVAEYRTDVTMVLTLIAQLFPKTQTATAKAQQAVDEAARVAILVGVK